MVADELARGRFQQSDVSQRDMYERGRIGFDLFSDYQPLSVHMPMTEIPNPGAVDAVGNAAEWPPQATIEIISYQGLSLMAKVKDAPFLRLHRFWLPGWRATVDGTATTVQPSGDLGLVEASLRRANRANRSCTLTLERRRFAVWLTGWRS